MPEDPNADMNQHDTAEQNLKDSSPPRARKHFKEHVAAIREATARISDGLAALQKQSLGDKSGEIVRALQTHAAQLMLAVNNAHAVPDEDPPENTGGARDTRAVDPSRHVE